MYELHMEKLVRCVKKIAIIFLETGMPLKEDVLMCFWGV